MQRLEVSGAVRPIYGSLSVKRLRSVRATIVAVEKAISVAYSECVSVTLGIQQAKQFTS